MDAATLPIKVAKPERMMHITIKKVVGHASIYHYNGIAERIPSLYLCDT